MNRNKLFAAVLATATAALAGACDERTAGEAAVRTEIRDADTRPGTVPADADTGVRSEMESACRPLIFENASFTHCVAVPGRHRIATVVKPQGGDPYRGFAALSVDRAADDLPVAFAMNGGMFDEAGLPIGYFVQDGIRIKELNRADGEGNFHMKPNGVFFGKDDNWQVRSTNWFFTNVSDRPDFGTQSGPMLVIEGALHPSISNDGESRLIRNGVGVDAKGRAHFVISNTAVSFGKLARLFRDELDADNALYLDGNVSSLWNPASDRLDSVAPIGPMIVVERTP